MRKVNKDYIDYEFTFKNITENNGEDFYSSTYVLLGRDKSIYQTSNFGNNSTELMKGLDIYTLQDNSNTSENNVVFTPGRCLITNLDTGESKLHFHHLQEVIPYNSSNLLSDGSTILDYGWVYVYALFNESSNTIEFKYSSNPPTRDKYGNSIKNVGERKTLYHSDFNARCIGCLILELYYNETRFGSGIFYEQMLKDNRLQLSSHKIHTPSGGTSQADRLLSDYSNGLNKQGGFPIIAYGTTVTVAGGTALIKQVDDDTELVEDENIIKKGTSKFIHAYSYYPSATVDTFYFNNIKDLYLYFGGSNFNKYSFMINILINR